MYHVLLTKTIAILNTSPLLFRNVFYIFVLQYKSGSIYFMFYKLLNTCQILLNASISDKWIGSNSWLDPLSECIHYFTPKEIDSISSKWKQRLDSHKSFDGFEAIWLWSCYLSSTHIYIDRIFVALLGNKTIIYYIVYVLFYIAFPIVIDKDENYIIFFIINTIKRVYSTTLFNYYIKYKYD